jgi:hypothetical protein
MDWVEAIVERKLREALERGDLDPGDLAGTDLDLDTKRPEGWWAQQFVEREKVRLRDEPDAARAMVAEWRREQRRRAERPRA